MKSKEWYKWALQTSAWSRVEGLIALKVTALEESMDNFWESRKSLTHFQLQYVYQVLKNKVQERIHFEAKSCLCLKWTHSPQGSNSRTAVNMGGLSTKVLFSLKNKETNKQEKQLNNTSLHLLNFVAKDPLWNSLYHSSSLTAGRFS